MSRSWATDSSTAEVSRGSGPQPQLKRTLGSFQVFAISFAFNRVAVGVFATYGELLATAGPVGIWLWVIAAVGQTLVALVIAQFAARIALSGSSYQWASRLASPKIGWMFGWLTFWNPRDRGGCDGQRAGESGVHAAGGGCKKDEATARVITVLVLVAQAALVIASTRLLGMITSGAVAVEIGIVAVLVIALAAAVVFAGSGDTANLTSRGITAGDSRLLRNRRRAHGGGAHGTDNARRLRLRRKPGRRSQGSVSECSPRDSFLRNRCREWRDCCSAYRADRRHRGSSGGEQQCVAGCGDHPL